jgi:hypothetical protein
VTVLAPTDTADLLLSLHEMLIAGSPSRSCARSVMV